MSLVNDAVNPAFESQHRPIIEVIYSLCISRPTAFTGATEWLLTCVDKVSLASRSSFVDAIVALLPSHAPADRERYMRTLATPIVARVLAAAQAVATASPVTPALLAALATEIGISGALMQFELPDPSDAQYMLQIFASQWPTLHQIMNAHAADEGLSKVRLTRRFFLLHYYCVLIYHRRSVCGYSLPSPLSNAIWATPFWS